MTVGLLAGVVLAPSAAAMCYTPVVSASVPAPYQLVVQDVTNAQVSVSQGNLSNGFTFAQVASADAVKLAGPESDWVKSQLAAFAQSLKPRGFVVSRADYVTRLNAAWFSLTSYYQSEAK